MSDKKKKQEEMERKLDEAIEGMEDACDNANGNCAKKVRSRTIRVKMSLMALIDRNLRKKETRSE